MPNTDTEGGNPMGVNNQFANYTYLLPQFDGSANSNVKAFFAQFENVATLGGWTPQQQLVILKTKLTGIAAKYLFENPELSEITQYVELKNKLIQFFCAKPSVVKQQALFTQCKQQSEETVRQFAYRVSIAARHYIIENKSGDKATYDLILDKLKFSKFLEGLAPHLKMECLKVNVSNFEEAVEHAERIEEITKSMQDTNITEVNNIFKLQSDSDSESKLEALRQEQIQSNTEIINAIKELRNVKISETKGHRERKNEDQTNPNRTRQGSNFFRTNERDNRKLCYYCNKIGHFMRECYTFNREVLQNQQTRQTNYSRDNNNKNNGQTKRYSNNQTSRTYYNKNKNQNLN